MSISSHGFQRQGKENRYYLHCRSYLADKYRFDFKGYRHHEEDGNTEKDDEIPAHHDYGKPTRNDAHDGQRHKAASEQCFVGNGVKISPQDCFLTQYPGQKAIQSISYAG